MEMHLRSAAVSPTEPSTGYIRASSFFDEHALAKRERQVTYVKLNGKYLRESQRLLAKGDYAHASEKLWGAMAEIIKAVAARRGLELGTHRSLGEFVSKLQSEHPDWDLVPAFGLGNALHTNFYEDWLPPDHVELYGDVIRHFIEKLQTLL